MNFFFILKFIHRISGLVCFGRISVLVCFGSYFVFIIGCIPIGSDILVLMVSWHIHLVMFYHLKLLYFEFLDTVCACLLVLMFQKLPSVNVRGFSPYCLCRHKFEWMLNLRMWSLLQGFSFGWVPYWWWCSWSIKKVSGRTWKAWPKGARVLLSTGFPLLKAIIWDL